MFVLQGLQGKLVRRKLKWHGGGSDRCRVCCGLKHVHRAQAHAMTDTCCARSRKGPFLNAKKTKSGKKGGGGEGEGGDMKLISHLINVTEDTQHNISACRDPRDPWEMNICPVDLSHLIQSWSALLRWRQSHGLCTLKVIGQQTCF